MHRFQAHGPALRVLAMGFVATFGGFQSVSADKVDVTWIGPDGGVWHDVTHWDPNTIPNNSGGEEFHAIVDTRFGSLVNLGSNATISNLTIGGDDLLHINNARQLFISALDEAGGVINNAGVIELGSTGSTTNIRTADGVVSLTGGGTILMSNHPSNWIYRATTDGALLNVDNIIEGAGQLSWGGAPTPITNQHLIIANQTELLTIQPSSALFTNEGTLRAEDGGTLELNAGTYDNSGGLIEARAGSLVRLDGSAFITGGTLDTEDDGLFRVTNSTPQLDDTTHAGHTVIDNSRVLLASGALHNTGLIELGSTGNHTYLRPADGELTLTGGGTIRLSDHTTNWIYRHDAGSSVVNVDNVIEGSGNLGWSASPTPFTNQHLVIANQTEPLTIQPGSALFTNSGTLRAEDGGTLRLNAGTYDNTGGLIESHAGSLVELNGSAVITGGTLDTEGDGQFHVTGNSPQIGDLTHTGHTIVNNNRTLRALGTITNTGTIEIGSTGGNTYLRPAGGPVTLTGGGTVLLSDTTANWMYRWDAESYWINQDNTVRGAGNLSWTGSRTGWINHGSIIADGENLLDIAPDSDIGFINHGLLHAQGSGGAQINGGLMDQMGTVLIDAGSGLTRTNGHYIQTAGTTTVEGTLVVTGSSNHALLQGGTLDGNGLVSGTLENVGGNISPGTSTGLLTVDELIQSGDGTLTIEINGDTPVNEHDLIEVLGHAALGGVLALQIDEGLSPVVGDQWEILVAETRSGQFAAVLPCNDIRIIYTDNAVIVEYTGVEKIGDLNCDGLVNGADLAVLLGAWGSCGNCGNCPADLNDSCTVDGADLAILLGNWG